MTNGSHDQTRGDSTPYVGGDHAVALSQNEVAALCLKAARGAGLSWGLAEEAGFAAAWLVQHGIDGPDHLHRHLVQIQGRAWHELRPTVTAGIWQAPAGGALCPIALGAALCDHADLPQGVRAGSPLRIGAVDHPVLLIPFLAASVASGDGVIDLSWDGGTVPVGGDPSALAGAVTTLGARQTGLILTWRSGPAQAARRAPAPSSAADTIAALNALAMLTTVPASEASRAGAGAASSDND